MTTKKIGAVLLFALVLLSLGGCGSMGYLLQAGRGQLAILNHTRPIGEVIQDERVAPRTRKLLGEVAPVKKFGEAKGLKPTKNYTEFVQLDRTAAVWVVSASEKLRFKSREWSFPIVGHVPYLGWFDRKDAEEFARELEREGWDVDLRGAGAYSTLGWFRDPIVSSMIPEGAEFGAALGSLVNVVLHESVHATFYIYGQAYFNESLAAFVGDRLTEEYLRGKYGPEGGEVKAYFDAEKRGETYNKRLHETYLELAKIYESSRPDEEKLKEKERILSALRDELKWRRAITNATLLDHKEYNTGLAEFAKVYEACGSDWGRFWGAIHTVTEKSFSQTNQAEVAGLILSLTDRCR